MLDWIYIEHALPNRYVPVLISTNLSLFGFKNIPLTGYLNCDNQWSLFNKLEQPWMQKYLDDCKFWLPLEALPPIPLITEACDCNDEYFS